MDRITAQRRLAKMLREYASKVGPRMLDDLSYPLAKIVLTRSGGVGVAMTDEQPDWAAYAYAEALPALARVKQMTEIAGTGEVVIERKIAREAEAFTALIPSFAAQLAAEACDHMLPMADGSQEVEEEAPPTSRLADDDEEPADHPTRPAVLVLIIWATFLLVMHAVVLAGGLIAAAVIGGLVVLCMVRRWGERLPNALLWVVLPIACVLSMVSTKSLQVGADQAAAYVQPAQQQPVATAAPAPQQAEAVASETTDSETRRWNADVQTLFDTYPALRYGSNAQILQEKVNAIAKPGMSNRDVLQQAYYETNADRRWAQSP